MEKLSIETLEYYINKIRKEYDITFEIETYRYNTRNWEHIQKLSYREKLLYKYIELGEIIKELKLNKKPAFAT
jgi:hypothetical protein